MRKWILVVALLFAVSAQAHAAFAIFQTAGQSLEPAVTTCNLNTGNCTGQDAGTGLFTAAVCDGVTNMSAAFTSFNTWARATTTNTNGQLIEATVTGVCLFGTGNVAPFRGLKKARLMGYGATFTGSGHLPNLGPADTIPGICHKALDDASGCSARINTVSAGATAVNINTTGYSGSLSALCGRFVAGRWAVVAGFDLQGGYNDPYGYPPNPHFFDYVQIVSTTNCASTGEITVSRALTYGYLSTWTLFNSGNVFEADQGGPGTIYALDQYWGGEVDLRGFTQDDPSNQSIYQGRYVRLQDVTMTGAGTICIIPSQNETFEMINSTGSACDIEVDKIINNLTYRGTRLKRLSFQSSSTNTLTWDGGSFNNAGGDFSSGINGTPKIANISNVTIPNLKIGPYAYGVGNSATCTNCVMNTDAGQMYTTPGIPDFTISSGVWSYPLGANVSLVSDNGSGKVRLTVDTTAGWVTGMVATKKNVYNCSPACTGGVQVTIVDGTTMDVLAQNFANVTSSTTTGFLSNSAVTIQRWAVPGTNILPTAFQGPGTTAFQVTGVTQSGNFVNIATTLPGGFPTMPQNGATSASIRPVVPSFRCTNCSGTPQADGDLNLAPNSRPLFSYSNRTYANSTTLTSVQQWGKVNSVKFNVTDAYTGTTNPMRFRYSGFAYPANTTTLGTFDWQINLRQAGLRTITTSGITCDTGGGPVAGACSGDVITPFADSTTFFVQTNLNKPNGSPTDDTWSLNAEFDLDQGVVP